MNNQNHKVAIVGSNGNFGKKRIRSFEQNNIQVKYCIDQAYEKEYVKDGLTFSKNVSLPLLDPEISIFCICTPDMFKKEIINDALNNNKHVFVEKPLSKSHADIDSFYQLAKDRNKVLSVGYNLIYFPSIKKILEIVSKGSLGKLKSFRLLYGHGGASGFKDKNNWRLSNSSWGGVEIDLECHMLDLLFNVGATEIKNFYSESRYYQDSKSTIERNTSLLCGPNNVLGSIYTSWECWKNTLDINLWFENGYIYSNGLLKYMKYGQLGEKLEVGIKNENGSPKISSYFWNQIKSESEDTVSEISLDMEFTDEEIKDFIQLISRNDYKKYLENEHKKNTFVASVINS